MKAEPLSLLKLFHNLNDEQFFIPVYQRHYSWEVKHCERLWSDLMRAGKDDKINAHFMGSVVYIEERAVYKKVLSRDYNWDRIAEALFRAL